ncbi:MarC family protein [Ancylomarina longa]|uniref:UPF0056 membrane protein n=1 Tax=Ancylomarina longa TaxID=2487017 RepID=A0A434AVC9_9BACT|nr:MarC family protein [Ancylomarina longa]RUT78326.1 MarC family protein [Ancylomarina longa]
MNEYWTFGLLAVTSFFTLINPLGVMPIFMTITSDLSPEQRKKTARKATIVSFFTLVAFAFSGQLLFNFFGISVNSLKVVGGIIFFIMGQDMLQARLSKIKVSEGEIQEYVNDVSITPLAIPMICGPGAITNGIVLMESANGINMMIILVASILIICLATYLILWGSSRITNFLGDTGNKILMRLMGLIVMVIAVEFFFSGLKPIIRDILAV